MLVSVETPDGQPSALTTTAPGFDCAKAPWDQEPMSENRHATTDLFGASDEENHNGAAIGRESSETCRGFQRIWKAVPWPRERCIACGIQHCCGGRTECNIQCCMIAVPGIRSYLWSDATGVILIADDAAIPKVV